MSKLRTSALKSLAILLCAVMFIACTGGGNEADYEPWTCICTFHVFENNGRERIVGDLSITLTVDKAEASMGDTITATVVFRNLSDADIVAEWPYLPATWWMGPLEDKPIERILKINMRNSCVPHAALIPYYEETSTFLIKSGALIKRQFEFLIVPVSRRSNYVFVRAMASFLTPESSDRVRGVQITSYPISVVVR